MDDRRPPCSFCKQPADVIEDSTKKPICSKHWLKRNKPKPYLDLNG